MNMSDLAAPAVQPHPRGLYTLLFGFAAAGLEMIGGLRQCVLMRGRLQGAGAKPEVAAVSRRNWHLLFGVLAVGCVVIAAGAQRAVSDPVWPFWLLLMYLLHIMGELCVSPMGLSSITKLAPARIVGQVMGVWFMATALGNLIAGLIAGESTSPGQMVRQFWGIALAAAGIATLLLLLSRPMRRWMAGVDGCIYFSNHKKEQNQANT
jgi:dipeptide/tripeptide permease